MTADRADISSREAAGCILISVTPELIQGNFNNVFRIDFRFTQKLLNSEYAHIGISYQVQREDFYEETPLLCRQKL